MQKIVRFSEKFQIFGKISDFPKKSEFWKNFRFSEKFQIFGKFLNFQISLKFSDFWKNFWVLESFQIFWKFLWPWWWQHSQFLRCFQKKSACENLDIRFFQVFPKCQQNWGLKIFHWQEAKMFPTYVFNWIRNGRLEWIDITNRSTDCTKVSFSDGVLDSSPFKLPYLCPSSCLNIVLKHLETKAR